MIPKVFVPYLVGAVLVILQLTINTALALEVQAVIDKNPVIVDESFTLTVSANDDLPRNAFQSDVLTGSFIVGATSVDRSTSIINGQMERLTRWRVTLIARRPGQYEIPSFNIDGKRTAPIVVDVVEPSESPSERGPVFVTAEVDNLHPFVQQQVRYTVKLHLAQTLESGSISPPDIDHADLQQASNDEDRQEIVDGQRYRVITRTYFITPRRSGELTIQGSRFDGQVRDSSTRSFATFSRPQSVTALAPDITLDVQAQPADYDGHWLPSEQVVLSEEWDEERRFIVGEPINRVVTLTALGVRDEQLPELTFNYPAELRFYPERTDRDSFTRQGQRFAQAQYRGVLIPAQAGAFELPSVEVTWWDISAERLRTASIPARRIDVHEPAGGLTSPLAQPSEPPQPSTEPTLLSGPHVTARSGWWIAATLVFAALWLFTLALAIWLWRRDAQPRRDPTVRNPPQVPVASRQPLRDLQQACKGNDAPATYSALNRWLKTTELPATNPAQLADWSDDEAFSSAILSLERALFSQHKTSWEQGQALWGGVQRLHQRPPKAADQAKLPSLYCNN